MLRSIKNIIHGLLTHLMLALHMLTGGISTEYLLKIRDWWQKIWRQNHGDCS